MRPALRSASAETHGAIQEMAQALDRDQAIATFESFKQAVRGPPRAL